MSDGIFRDTMRRVRKARGWSQTDLANKAGLSRGIVGKIEVGIRGISLAEAIAICSALGMSLEVAVRGEPVVLSITVNGEPYHGPRPACPECGMGGDVGADTPNPIPF